MVNVYLDRYVIHVYNSWSTIPEGHNAETKRHARLPKRDHGERVPPLL